ATIHFGIARLPGFATGNPAAAGLRTRPHCHRRPAWSLGHCSDPSASFARVPDAGLLDGRETANSPSIGNVFLGGALAFSGHTPGFPQRDPAVAATQR